MITYKRIKAKLFQTKSFLREEAGAVLVIYALSLIPIIGFLGLSIDLGRNYYIHSFITGAVDAAAIAGAKAGGTPENMTQQANAIFKANIPSNFKGTIAGPTVTISSNNQIINVSAKATIDTTFMKILGLNTISAEATAQAKVSTTGAEVVLALDNTGSMAGSPMQGEIDAAKVLVNILYGGSSNDTAPGLWVGVVPYTTTVNINMPSFSPSNWLTTAGKQQIANTNLYPNIPPISTSVGGRWMGCIEARPSPLDQQDNPPTSDTTRFTPFLYPSTMAHKYVFGQQLDRVNPLGSPPWKGAVRGDNDWNLDGTVPTTSLYTNPRLFFGDNYNFNRQSDGNNGVGPNLGCPIPMLPLTASQTTVLNTINNMKATFRGGTMINIGLNAAWWMLSPNWRGLWPNTPSTLPQDYGKTLKVVVLMTDGYNQWYDWPVGNPGLPDLTHNYALDADYTGYGRLAAGRIGSATNVAAARTLLNQRMLNMCTILKNNGVVIYTIMFDHNGSASDPATQAIFLSCASDSSKYFLTFTNQDLTNAFQNIGKSIANLRLSWPGTP